MARHPRATDPQATSSTHPPGVWDADRRFRTAVEALHEGLAVYSSIRNERGEIVDFRCEYANRAATANRGLPPEEQVGKTLLEKFPGVAQGGILDRYIEVVETGVALAFDVPWYEDTTTKGAFELRAARLDDGFVLAFRDVTAQRDRERKTAHLAATAAHDLGAPLRAITGFAELLEKEYASRLGADADEWIGYIIASAARMRVLIDDMLTFARAGGPDHAPEVIDLTALASGVRDGLESAIQQVGAHVEVAKLPIVEADVDEVERLLRNLFSNALKFARVGTASRIVVDAEPAGAQWVIRVSDNGVGVPEDERERIFEPFYRGPGTSEHQGSGLGLAVCRRIAQRHGGEIWVEPGPDGGSRFCITLPASGASAAPPS